MQSCCAVQIQLRQRDTVSGVVIYLNITKVCHFSCVWGERGAITRRTLTCKLKHMCNNMGMFG